MDDTRLISLIKKNAYPLKSDKNNFDSLLDLIGDASWVLLGEATHGTQEFYSLRAEITQQLIEKKGFSVVALEADWPDAHRINEYIQHESSDKTFSALDGFKRFPQWMWRNTVVVDFIGWLYRYNGKATAAKKISLYGLDLYSLFSSIHAVINYLESIDPAAAQRARIRYKCFEQYEHNIIQYGLDMSRLNISKTGQDDVIEQIKDLHRNSFEFLRADGAKAHAAFFNAERNAHVIKNAEHYYRSFFFSNPATSWNIRDTHMFETAVAIHDHTAKTVKQPKIIIWAHNSHIGNAAATQMASLGELNLGQLIKATYKDDAKLIGFTTHTGTVAAASEWDSPVEHKKVRPSLENSFENLFHRCGIPQFLLPLHQDPELAKLLKQERLERAIGVIYRPETERQSHYFKAQLSAQFDAIIHYDQTKALQPLETTSAWTPEPDQTYPTGI